VSELLKVLLRPANAAPGEQLPYSPGLVREEGGGANVNMADVSLRSRDNPYLRFPGTIRALVLQTTHISSSDDGIYAFADQPDGGLAHDKI